MRIGVLTISTSMAQGERGVDASGNAIVATMTASPFAGTIGQRATVADDREATKRDGTGGKTHCNHLSQIPDNKVATSVTLQSRSCHM